MTEESDSVLFIHHLDLVTPFKTTVAHYLSTELSRQKQVHVVCRKQPDRRKRQDVPDEYVLHDIDTGDVAVVSGLLFFVVSTVYAFVLSLRNRYDVVYSFQDTMIQGWVASRVADARFVVGLVSVPVRQYQDFVQSSDREQSPVDKIKSATYSRYTHALRRILEEATEVVCLTEGIRDVTMDVHGVDISHAHVVGMGIDIETFAREKAPRDDSRPWTITYVGTMASNRGIDDLLEAVAALDYEVQLLLAGDGTEDYLSELRAKARDLDIDDRVQWLGIVPHGDVPGLLHRSDIAVSPLDDIESYRVSFPAKLLEYMAAGCAVVATDIPAHRRVIEDGENGLLYENGVANLERALTRCIEDDEFRESIEREARTTAERHRWDEIVDRHATVMFE